MRAAEAPDCKYSRDPPRGFPDMRQVASGFPARRLAFLELCPQSYRHPHPLYAH
jgi:hypothetical protein